MTGRYISSKTRKDTGLFIPGKKTLVAMALTSAFASAQAADINLLDRDRSSEYTVTATSSDLLRSVSNINDGRSWTAWSNNSSETYYNDVVEIEFNVPSQVSGIMIHG